MNLEEKKAEFVQNKTIQPEFAEAMRLFDQKSLLKEIESLKAQSSLVDRVVGSELKHGNSDFALGLHIHYAIALRQEIDENRVLLCDSPFYCTADYYRKVIENMGFECVGTYPVNMGDSIETTYTHARPDGLFISWDTGTSTDGIVMRSSANMHFQWIGFDKNDHPEGCSGQWYRTQENAWIYCGSHDVREGVREVIQKLTSNGSFCSPYPIHDPEAILNSLSSNNDMRAARKELQRRKVENDGPMEESIYFITKGRYEHLPIWAKEMIRPMLFEQHYLKTNPMGLRPK